MLHFFLFVCICHLIIGYILINRYLKLLELPGFEMAIVKNGNKIVLQSQLKFDTMDFQWPQSASAFGYFSTERERGESKFA